MLAAQHLDYTEQILAELKSGDSEVDNIYVISAALEAIGHALVAIADMLGVPHAPGPAAGDGNAG